MMSSVVIPISADYDDEPKKVEDQQQKASKWKLVWNILGCPGDQQGPGNGKYDVPKMVHSIKVGIALVLVSLFIILDPLYQEVKDQAVWAIMTVVVVFEFYAGATLCKGILRILATIAGGLLGSCAAFVALKVDGTDIGGDILIGCSVFIFGAVATRCRLIPEIKKRYDYGMMIFLLTFSMVAVSGYRNDVLTVAKQRLSAVAIGFVICIFVSLLIFPIWSGDELHQSIISNFETLASALEGCFEEYFKVDSETESKPLGERRKSCELVLNSKAKDESMANFAKWEPWHGRFGLLYPWSQYIPIGDVLRELAALLLSLNVCLQSSRQSSVSLETTKEMIKEPCEAAVMSITWTLRELKESMMKTRKCPPKASIATKLRDVRVELSQALSCAKLDQAVGGDGESVVEALAASSFAFCLMEMVKGVEELTKEVEVLGELADY